MSILRSLRRLAGGAALTLALTTALTAGVAAPAHAVAVPPVGSVICHDGQVSGWQCGVLNAVNVTIAYPDGVVSGLFRYSACSLPGDQGSPVYHARTQIGTVFGGSGCQTYGMPLD